MNESVPFVVSVGNRDFVLVRDLQNTDYIEYMTNDADGPALFALLKAAPYMTIKGKTSRGTDIFDVFDLQGFTENVDRLTEQ